MYDHEFLLNVQPGDVDPGAVPVPEPAPLPAEAVPEGAVILFENDHYVIAGVMPYGRRWYRKVAGATRGQANRALEEYRVVEREARAVARQKRLDARKAASEARRARKAKPLT